jgi:hypothetical protein
VQCNVLSHKIPLLWYALSNAHHSTESITARTANTARTNTGSWSSLTPSILLLWGVHNPVKLRLMMTVLRDESCYAGEMPDPATASMRRDVRSRRQSGGEKSRMPDDAASRGAADECETLERRKTAELAPTEFLHRDTPDDLTVTERCMKHGEMFVDASARDAFERA